jgi:hypothetical protein
MDLVKFILLLKSASVAPFIIDTLLPAAQTTSALVGIPRFQNQSYQEYKDDIDVTACLTLIQQAAMGCARRKEHTIRFWRLMRVDVVLMMLSPQQPLQDLDIMLQLLAMSVTKDSVGPILRSEEAPQDIISAIINKMTLFLVPPMQNAKTAQKLDKDAVANLKLQILRTLQAFCQFPVGGEAIAKHTHTIGRLVKLMSDELDRLYDYRSDHERRFVGPLRHNRSPIQKLTISQRPHHKPLHAPHPPPRHNLRKIRQHARKAERHPRRLAKISTLSFETPFLEYCGAGCGG